ncbi:MAG: hypothetical protein K0R65_3015 [Crocinitomicaceae bacterium]|nr:hypothetical protein [Crocinitomicaceae bacterium]
MTMKTILTLFVALGAQLSFAQAPLQNIKKDIQLTVQSDAGYNGLAVAYNPKQNVYYSVFAGNASFPLEIHNASTGASIYTREIGADIRGMWYNPKKDQIQGILVGNEGLYTMDLDGNTISSPAITNIAYGMDFNDIACYHNKKIYFLNGNGLTVFKQGKTKAVKNIYPEVFGAQGSESFNMNGFFHTGVKGYEIGVLNFADGKLYLINESNGKTAAMIDITFDTDYPEMDRFKISYANKRVFLYNVNSRAWDGYKLF